MLVIVTWVAAVLQEWPVNPGEMMRAVRCLHVFHVVFWVARRMYLESIYLGTQFVRHFASRSHKTSVRPHIIFRTMDTMSNLADPSS